MWTAFHSFVGGQLIHGKEDDIDHHNAHDGSSCSVFRLPNEAITQKASVPRLEIAGKE